MLFSTVYPVTSFNAQKTKTGSHPTNLQKTQPQSSTSGTQVKPKSQPKFSGFLNKLYNELIAEPFAGYRKIEDQWGDLKSPAGSGNARQDRKNQKYTDRTSFHNAGLKCVDFNHSTFPHGANFKKSVCEIVDFSHCNMPSANFEGSVLNGSDFIGSHLTGANFSECDLEKLNGSPEEKFWKNVTDRHGGNLYASTTRELSDLNSKSISYYSSFEDANLVGANFENSDLKEVNFRNANLRHANFKKARMQGADLTGARLLAANFEDTMLEGAKINLDDVFEKEIAKGEDGTVTIIKLGELMRATGLKLGIQDPNTAQKINDLLDARDQGRITSHELESTLRKHFIKAYNPGLGHKKPPLETVIPSVFAQAYTELQGSKKPESESLSGIRRSAYTELQRSNKPLSGLPSSILLHSLLHGETWPEFSSATISRLNNNKRQAKTKMP